MGKKKWVRRTGESWVKWGEVRTLDKEMQGFPNHHENCSASLTDWMGDSRGAPLQVLYRQAQDRRFHQEEIQEVGEWWPPNGDPHFPDNVRQAKRLTNVLYRKSEMATGSDMLPEEVFKHDVTNNNNDDNNNSKNKETEVEEDTTDAPVDKEIGVITLGQPVWLLSSSSSSPQRSARRKIPGSMWRWLY